MGLRCAGQLAGDGWGLQDSSPAGDPFPWGPPYQVFLAPCGARAGLGHPRGEKSLPDARARDGPGGAGTKGAQAEQSVRTLVEPQWEELSTH